MTGHPRPITRAYDLRLVPTGDADGTLLLVDYASTSRQPLLALTPHEARWLANQIRHATDHEPNRRRT